tara:strand:- start:1636 stop:2394 length:759 start_codon:yes stop_codon:yes gene_type:complete
MFNKILISLVAIFCLIFILRNEIIKQYLSYEITKIIKYETSIGDLDYSIKKNKLVIKDLKIKNPDGYKNIFALWISEVSIDNPVIQNDKLIINAIKINNADIFYDNNNGVINFKEISENIKRYLHAKKSLVVKENETTSNINPNKDEENKQIVKTEEPSIIFINNLQVKDSYITLYYKFMLKKSVSIPLEDYINVSQELDTLLNKFNSYIEVTAKKIKASKRRSDLLKIFPKWEKQINKLNQELDKSEPINF